MTKAARKSSNQSARARRAIKRQNFKAAMFARLAAVKQSVDLLPDDRGFITKSKFVGSDSETDWLGVIGVSSGNKSTADEAFGPGIQSYLTTPEHAPRAYKDDNASTAEKARKQLNEFSD